MTGWCEPCSGVVSIVMVNQQHSKAAPWCAFKGLLTCKFKSVSSSVLSIEPQRIGDAFYYVHCSSSYVAYTCFYLWSSFAEVCKTGLVVWEMDAPVWNEGFLPLPLAAVWILSLSPLCVCFPLSVCWFYKRALPLPFCSHWAAAVLFPSEVEQFMFLYMRTWKGQWFVLSI